MDAVWSAERTSPAAISEGLRALLRGEHEDGQAHSPARVLNLVAVVDREWRGEIANKLEGVSRSHPSRTIVCSAERKREDLDAWATIDCGDPHGPGSLKVCREWIEIQLGYGHLPHLDTVVDSILVTDLPTLVWSPHRHPEAIDSMVRLADAVLIDSVEEPSIIAALARAEQLSSEAYVVDLAWLRGRPWRERIAAAFDPPAWRPALEQISALTIRHSPDAAMAALLLAGWLASRVGWKTRSLIAFEGTLQGRLRGGRQHVEIRLEGTGATAVPGVEVVAIEEASGDSVTFERTAGGFVVVRKSLDGESRTWTVPAASSDGEGLLGEGVRQALLGDQVYGPALEAAKAMLQ